MTNRRRQRQNRETGRVTPRSSAPESRFDREGKTTVAPGPPPPVKMTEHSVVARSGRPEHRVVICAPSNRTWPMETADSFAGVYGHGLVEGVVTAKLTIGDTYIDTARNLLVTYAMDIPTEPTHIFWFDDDMIVPADAIPRLLAHKKPVVGGLYFQRVPPFRPVVYEWRTEDTMVDLQAPEPEELTGLKRVGGLGLGCTLVEIGIYPAMAEKYGDARWHEVSEGRGEDVHFFARCEEMGIPVYLDCDLDCGHVTRDAIGKIHYTSYREAARRQTEENEAARAADADRDPGS